jgi:hypothetical protein
LPVYRQSLVVFIAEIDLAGARGGREHQPHGFSHHSRLGLAGWPLSVKTSFTPGQSHQRIFPEKPVPFLCIRRSTAALD